MRGCEGGHALSIGLCGAEPGRPLPGKQQEPWLPEHWLCAVTVRDGVRLGSARLQVLGPTENLGGGEPTGCNVGENVSRGPYALCTWWGADSRISSDVLGT